jgi:hypothetical protein
MYDGASDSRYQLTSRTILDVGSYDIVDRYQCYVESIVLGDAKVLSKETEPISKVLDDVLRVCIIQFQQENILNLLQLRDEFAHVGHGYLLDSVAVL